MQEFNKETRCGYLSDLKDNTFDVVVLGGGVLGAGILLDAVSRGLKAILIEQHDFAFGTEASVFPDIRIHKSKEGQEQRVLIKNAPHVVYHQKILKPIYNAQSRLSNAFKLSLYDKITNAERPYYTHYYLNKQKLIEAYPIIKSERLKGGFFFYGNRAKQGRLTMDLIKTSLKLGAYALNDVVCNNISENADSEVVLSLSDKLNGEAFQLKTKTLVNVASHCSEEAVRGTFDTSIRLVKRNYLLLDRAKLNIPDAVYLPFNKEQFLTLVPIGTKVHIGTDLIPTETQNPILETEKESVLSTVNKYFKTDIQTQDLDFACSNFQAVHQENSLNDDSEKIVQHSACRWSVVGGKWSAYRAISEHVIDLVLKNNSNLEFQSSQTLNMRLSGADFKPNPVEAHHLNEYAEQRFPEAFQVGADKETVYKLVYRYGTNMEVIMNRAFDSYRQLDPSVLWLDSEIWYLIQYEMLLHLSDFMMYRTDALYSEQGKDEAYIKLVANIMAKYLNWDEATIQQEIEAYRICTFNK